MNDVFALADAESASDLGVFLSRAKKIDDQAVRMVAQRGVLAVYAPVMYRRGLLDDAPTVIGLRTFHDLDRSVWDRVVAPASISERLAHRLGEPDSSPDQYRITMPGADVRASWAGITPPRGGWFSMGSVSSRVLSRVARAGAADIAVSLPSGAGDAVVQKVRSSVWSREIPEFTPLVSGAAFAADALGFLGADDEDVPVFESSGWLRLSPRRGHVLVRARPSAQA